MISTNDIKNYAKKVFSASQGRRDRAIMHPDRDWFLVVSAFLVLFIAAVAFSVFQYQQYQSLSERVAPEEDTLLPQYNEQLVQYFVDEYAERMAIFEADLGLHTTSSDTTLEQDLSRTEDFLDEDFSSTVGTSSGDFDSTESGDTQDMEQDQETEQSSESEEIIFVDS